MPASTYLGTALPMDMEKALSDFDSADFVKLTAGGALLRSSLPPLWEEGSR